jgi:hypothetical protein
VRLQTISHSSQVLDRTAMQPVRCEEGQLFQPWFRVARC